MFSAKTNLAQTTLKEGASCHVVANLCLDNVYRSDMGREL